MDTRRAKAYRYLLYWALLEIRGLGSYAWRRGERWNPLFLIRSVRYVRSRGALAEWLHNLGQFAANDFESFDETWFWREYAVMERKHGANWRYDYRKIFEEHFNKEEPRNPSRLTRR